MNVFLVIVLVIGGIFVFFIPMIMGKATGTSMKISGRKVFIYKEPRFEETVEGRELLIYVLVLEKQGYGPYSHFGMMQIRNHLSKLPKHQQTLNYTNDNIKIMLKMIGIEENAHTRRVPKQPEGVGFSITGSL